MALVPYTWKKRVTEALHIHQQASTLNLDCATSAPYGTPSLIIPPHPHQRLPIPQPHRTIHDSDLLLRTSKFQDFISVHVCALCHHYVTTCPLVVPRGLPEEDLSVLLAVCPLVVPRGLPEALLLVVCPLVVPRGLPEEDLSVLLVVCPLLPEMCS